MFHEHHHYGWYTQPKIVNPEPWRRVAGRKQPQPQLPRKQVQPRMSTKRQGRQG